MSLAVTAWLADIPKSSHIVRILYINRGSETPRAGHLFLTDGKPVIMLPADAKEPLEQDVGCNQ
jgi:hypothetical protein